MRHWRAVWTRPDDARGADPGTPVSPGHGPAQWPSARMIKDFRKAMMPMTDSFCQRRDDACGSQWCRVGRGGENCPPEVHRTSVYGVWPGAVAYNEKSEPRPQLRLSRGCGCPGPEQHFRHYYTFPDSPHSRISGSGAGQFCRADSRPVSFFRRTARGSPPGLCPGPPRRRAPGP